jgi:type VII secretion protein EccB
VPSRQDQLHSYQYSLQRVVAALVTHDPDPSRSPLRRAGSMALISLLVALIAVGGTAAYGAITGRRPVQTKDEGAVFIEKESGAQFVYLKRDDRLHPVLNLSSGLLIVGSAQARTVTVARKALAKVQLGDPMGIPGAPDSLPRAGDLIKQSWTICSLPDDSGRSGVEPQSLLVIGAEITDGTTVEGAAPGTAGEALLVTDPDDRTYLVYGNRRFLIPAGRVRSAKTALGWNDRTPQPVAAAWINAVPAGPNLEPPAIANLGAASAIADARVGQLFKAASPSQAGTFQWAVALTDGAAAITEVQANLLLADRRTAGPVGEPLTLTASEFSSLEPSDTRLSTSDATAGPPATAPALVTAARRLCLAGPDAKRPDVRVWIDPTMPPGVAVDASSPVSGRILIDQVHVPRARGAVVEAAASPTAPAGSGTISVVTDTGTRYPVANRTVLEALGYSGVTPVQVPAEMVALLPEGPSLDPTRARQSRTEDD